MALFSQVRQGAVRILIGSTLFFLLRFLTPPTFTWRFKKILKANDLPTDLNVHSLRHTAASLFIASGTDVGTVAGLLGHSQPSTTLDIYTHAFDKNKEAASQIMQNELEI